MERAEGEDAVQIEFHGGGVGVLERLLRGGATCRPQGLPPRRVLPPGVEFGGARIDADLERAPARRLLG